ncbi:DUF2909 domain-containing protein [Catenovulum sp. SM1970]|uniref:DUF2909 domain-containing protein n=1 Tax=Marinifaba aquimaris TaxID=2741323 RepID=UPI001571EF0B|nr:DUF2909 domain-containing protein [Marinifaba aquimaris]NTS76524.1 DUF2909 domain-containing protein [Marinifaba aquimaris]
MALIIKIAIVLLFCFVVFNLARALFSMLKSPAHEGVSSFIGKRLWFACALLLVFVLAASFGYITPNPTPY